MSLAYQLIHDEPSPERWMLLLHGILGRGANWRTFARRWDQRRPGWGAVLVDLRDHGASQDLPGPRTLAAAGIDLVSTVEAIEGAQGGHVEAILGHSFGAKVAISGAAALRAAGAPIKELWLIDAPPGPRAPGAGPGITAEVFAALTGLPAVFDSRRDFVEQLVAGGIAKPTAQWLATNLTASGPSWRFGLDLERVQALIQDFGERDLWPLLERELEAGVAATLVLAERSEAVSPDERRRAEATAARARLRVAVVPRAGHWVHVDNPEALLDLVAGPDPC